MRIISGQGFTEHERREFVADVHLCILSCIKKIVEAMDKLEIPYLDPFNEAHSRRIKAIDYTANYRLTPEHVSLVRCLWADLNVKSCYDRRREYQLPDSASYFFNEIDRICPTPHNGISYTYVPTDQDILRVRTVPTTGINEYTFEDKVLFRIVDVGGQRSERRKWIHCFQDVTSVIFLAALSEYDQFLLEADGVNRLDESLALFQTIATYYGFEKSSFILFLNKKDLLEEKIQTSHLQDYFPEYVGPQRDHIEARKFILNLYLRDSHDRVVYPHFTCATDTENIRVVFTAVKDTILRKNLDEYILS